MRVLMVCINYRSAARTHEFVRSLGALKEHAALEVVVVDNSWQDAPLTLGDGVTDLKVSVVRPPRNLGYFGGAAFGLEQYLSSNEFPDWVVISNVDLAIDSADYLAQLEKALQVPDLGVIAPSILSGLTGHDQNPYFRQRPSRARMHRYRWVFGSYPGYVAYALGSQAFRRARRLVRRAQTGSAQPADVYAPHGSHLIFSREYFRRGASLDYPCFLFGEEIFVAENCRRLGLRVRYEPAIRVRHDEHVSTGFIRSRPMVRFAHEAATFCATSYFGSAQIGS